MIDVKKYFQGDYVKNESDCWTLLQDIFENEHNITLPDFPICGLGENEYSEYLISNLIIEEIEEPEIGCIIHKSGIIEHVGYNVDNRYYIHKTKAGTKCDRIKRSKCTFYKVLS